LLMARKIQRKTYIINAENKVLGRLAGRIALILDGKRNVEYLPNFDTGDIVVVKNIGKIKITGQKLEQKKYYHHSGHPGGLKTKKMGEVFEKNPGEVLRRAVYKMLPANKLRKEMIKRLRFER